MGLMGYTGYDEKGEGVEVGFERWVDRKVSHFLYILLFFFFVGVQEVGTLP